MTTVSNAMVPHGGGSGEATASEWYREVPRSIRKQTIFGLVLLIITFGSFSAWALYAPLAAAVIAQGSFVATGQNKVIQHLEGGIIKEILANEGDRVEAGDPLLLLDETAALSNQRQLELRRYMLEAISVRLQAEFQELEHLAFPDHLTGISGRPEIAEILRSQERNFEASRNKLTRDLELLQSNIDSLEARSEGYRRQLKSVEEQIRFLREELASKSELLDQGFMRQPEISALRRAIADAEGQSGRLEAEIVEASVQMRKYEQQMEQTRSAYRETAVDELQAVEAEYDSVREQIRAADNVLRRSTIAAPVTGTIVRAFYHTAGGVIESGKPIFEITPAGVPLIIEAQVTRNDVDSVALDQNAIVRLVSLNQRTTPVLNGVVRYVSADSVAIRKDGLETDVYFVRVSVPREELDRIPGFSPTPGMPAEVMVQTETRTFFSYLARPVVDSMSRAFREQ